MCCITEIFQYGEKNQENKFIFSRFLYVNGKIDWIFSFAVFYEYSEMIFEGKFLVQLVESDMEELRFLIGLTEVSLNLSSWKLKFQLFWMPKFYSAWSSWEIRGFFGVFKPFSLFLLGEIHIIETWSESYTVFSTNFKFKIPICQIYNDFERIYSLLTKPFALMKHQIRLKTI